MSSYTNHSGNKPRKPAANIPMAMYASNIPISLVTAAIPFVPKTSTMRLATENTTNRTFAHSFVGSLRPMRQRIHVLNEPVQRCGRIQF